MFITSFNHKYHIDTLLISLHSNASLFLLYATYASIIDATASIFLSLLSLNNFLFPFVSSSVILFPIANVIRSSSNKSARASARVFNSPRGTDSVLNPCITFSTPNGPFSAVHLSTNSLHYMGQSQSILYRIHFE